MKVRTRKQIAEHSAVDQIFRDSDGWWIWLKPGWWSCNMECGTIHELTIAECCAEFGCVEFAPRAYLESNGQDYLAEAIANGWIDTGANDNEA